MNDLLKSLAPLLGTAIAGPFGGIAASFLAEKLGVPEKTVSAVTEALNADKLTPDQATQIKLAEIEFKKWMGDNQLKADQLRFEDTKSAREMNIATKAVTPAILTWIVVALTLAAEGALLFNQIPPGADPIILGRVLGTMDSALMLVLGFWFGSSHGSQNKDALLAAK
jgi:plasmid maintenance system antidote protein VapI